MDKSWTNETNTFSESYIKGVEVFLNFAKENVMGPDKLIHCPCRSCNNTRFKSLEEVKLDLHINGFSYNYPDWIFHGERVHIFSDNENDIVDNIDESMKNTESLNMNDGLFEMLTEMDEINQVKNNAEGETKGFSKLLGDADQELYPGCKKSLLSVVIKLLHIKVMNKWSNKSFDMLLEFLKEILPEGETLPSSLYGAKKILADLGLGYEEIDACKNDCTLFYKENEKSGSCHICNESRWKVNDGKGNQIPHKILRYFPLKPRLQRLFRSNKTASNMRWHKEKRKDEMGTMRHPADSRAWKHFDEQYPQFAQDPRNVKLGLATDGFTPWSNLGNSYSMWPVILIPYNLPPYMCMKKEFLMMSLLIPGPRSPGKDIDTYLRPLVDELKELWEIGIETYDIHSKENFRMHAAILWTISDFPGYAYVSGWMTMGYLACPCCFDQTRSKKLRTKPCFMGHRCFLAKNHSWRKNKEAFDGQEEHRSKPKELSGNDVLHWLNNLSNVFTKPGKHPAINQKRKRSSYQANWVKKSIFFELPYWPKLLIRHNLDVMHIEKNICDNILGTLLDIKGKTKDTENARVDLCDWGIRKELHMQRRASDNKLIKPRACYTLFSKEKYGFYEFLKSIKFPDGYAANISRCVKENKISGLKSHDCHILLQRIIPAGIRGYLGKEINEALFELGEFFRELCSKTLKLENLERLEKNIPLILCKLEKIFPPAFFTIMVHLAVHLPREAKIAGPVQPRWMYPIERYLGTLKGFVRNRARPEGSIAEAYIVKESLMFMSMYLQGIETRSNRRKRNYDGAQDVQIGDLSVFSMRTRPFGHIKPEAILSDEEFEKAHQFILSNCDEVEQYMKIYKAELLGIPFEQADDLVYDERQMKGFPEWFRKHMNILHYQRDAEATDQLWALANGPFRMDTKCYSGCMVNEVRFHTNNRDSRRRTQNSGLVVEGNHKNHMIEFFGLLSRVLELTYLGDRKVVLFQCEWFNTGSKKTMQVDKHFMSIDVRSRWYKDDPFVLPIQVQQVFYINDTKLGEYWKLVQRVQHRHLWDLSELRIEDDNVHNPGMNPFQQFESNGVSDVVENDEEAPNRLVREDVEPEVLDDDNFHKTRQTKPRPAGNDDEEDGMDCIDDIDEDEENDIDDSAYSDECESDDFDT